MVLSSMRWLVAGISLVVAACGDDGYRVHLVDGGPEPVDARPLNGPCDVLEQNCGAGEKCTWIIDSLMPQYMGHIGCALDGNANVGESCAFDDPSLSGYDS